MCVLTDSILRRKVNGVCVEELEEGSVDGVRELVDLYDLLLILRPLGAKHGPEVFAPAPVKSNAVNKVQEVVSCRILQIIVERLQRRIIKLLTGHAT